MLFIGVDPGKGGCIAWIEAGIPGGQCGWTAKLGSLTEADIIEELVCMSESKQTSYAVIERVRSSSQMGVTSAFTFGRGYGLLLGALTASQIPFAEVLPNKWQGALGCRTKGEKNVTKRKAQQLFPKSKITHVNADALLMAKYCQQNYKSLF